jgi:hypothetical protein
LLSDEAAEVPWHCAMIMCHQHKPLLSCLRQDYFVCQSNESSGCRRLKLDRRFASDNCQEDRLVQVGVILKSDRHVR